MYKYLIITFFTCLLFQEEPTIKWQDDLKLEWRDFKAKPTPTGIAVATTASGISFGYSTTRSSSGLVDYSFDISAHFYPNKSWRVNKPLSSVVLAHERLHFDITELFARRFRQRIANTKFTNAIKNEMNQIHNDIIEELSEMQKRYDLETNHSQIIEKQTEWQTFIAEELKKLTNYS